MSTPAARIGFLRTPETQRDRAALHRIVAAAAAAGVLAIGGAAKAQTRPTWPVGPMEAYPILSAGVGYASDVIKTESGDKDSWVLTAYLGGGLRGKHGEHFHGLEYEGTLRRFNESSDDNAYDNRLTAYGGHAFDIRNNVKGGIEYLDQTDPRGYDDVTADRRDTRGAPEPDEWHQTQIGATYIYGAPEARGRVQCDACQTWRRHDNNDQEYRDRDILDLGVTLSARVQPKTRLLLGIMYSDFDYVSERPEDLATAGSLDSEETRYFLGAEWETTEKLSAIARVGYLQKHFEDSDQREDYDEPWWALEGQWTPRERTRIGAGFSRFLYESVPESEDAVTVEDDFVQVEDLHLDWSQRWSERLSTTVTGYRRWEDWSPSGREDDVYGISAGFSYSVSRLLNVGLSAYYRNRDSNDPEAEYDDSGVALTIQFTGGWDALSPFACELRGSGYYEAFYAPHRKY